MILHILISCYCAALHTTLVCGTMTSHVIVDMINIRWQGEESRLQGKRDAASPDGEYLGAFQWPCNDDPGGLWYPANISHLLHASFTVGEPTMSPDAQLSFHVSALVKRMENVTEVITDQLSSWRGGEINSLVDYQNNHQLQRWYLNHHWAPECLGSTTLTVR